jgi:M6 family metalloprotease-like protein
MFRKSDYYLVLFIVMALVSLSVGTVSAATVTQSITYQGTNAAGTPLTGSPPGSFEFRTMDDGMERTMPHPYLVSHLYDKLKQIKSNISGSEIQQTDSEPSAYPPDFWRPALRSTGDNKMLVILIDFPDAVHDPNQTRYEVNRGFNGPRDNDFPQDNVHDFYNRSSYGKFNLTADVYNWCRASHPREYYDTFDNLRALPSECMSKLDPTVDFTQYDNDKDGDIDILNIVYASNKDSTYWGGFIMAGTSATWDSLPLDNIIVSPYNNDMASVSGDFYPFISNHEIGHALGLTDYYDYEPSVGPCGGIGGFDLMSNAPIDHNSFSKYLLDWIDPLVITDGEHIVELKPSSESPDAVLILPKDANDTNSEFFMIQTRSPHIGNDNASYRWWYIRNWSEYWSSTGLAIWHVDATLNDDGTYWKYDNSVSSHKLLRLMEADGLEELDKSCTISNSWNPGDLYYPGQTFGTNTIPNSINYKGLPTWLRIDQITQEGSGLKMRVQINPVLPSSGIGVFRSGQWIVDYGIDGTVDRRFQYGLATDRPLVGDFNNDGITDIGVFRSGQWILDYGMDGVVDRRFYYGLPTDIPVVGDFNNDGITDIGVFRSGQWILDYGIDGTVNSRFFFGLPTDKPVVGDFNNDGITDIGVYRSGQWILDYGIDGIVDRRFNYGLPTDIPIVGAWA